jgi:hypothetical protein
MGLKVTTLDDLSTELVMQAQAEMGQLISDRHPTVEIAGGVISDIVVYFAGGVGGGINQTEVNRVLQSQSLLAIGNNPDLQEDEIADHVFSNYRVSRNTGTAARGEIAIVVSGDGPVVLSAGARFTANGVEFVADAAFIARPPGTVVTSANERVLEPVSGNNFVFSIDATASDLGTSGNISRGTRLAPARPIDRYVNSYAATDFRGGTDTETNGEVLTRLEQGIAAKAWSNRVNIVALVKEQPAFAQTVHYSIIGYGNPEMHRDRHSIFPVSMGGRVDMYARTEGLSQEQTIRKTAVLVDIVAGGSVWQFSLNRDDFPGFYEVTKVLPTDGDPSLDSGFVVQSDVRGYDLSGDGFVPDVISAEEGAYSRYQTAVIQFLDTETNTAELTIGDSAEYDVIVAGMPLIAELQLFCGGSEVRNTAGDILVKAPIPCFLSVNFDIEQAAGETSPDTDAIKIDIASRVNALDFPGQLHASIIADVVHNYLSARQAVGPINMLGRIRQPSGENLYVRDQLVLILPTKNSTMTTGRTTALLLDPNNIGISVVTKGFDKST